MRIKDWIKLIVLVLYVVIWSHLFVTGTYVLAEDLHLNQGVVFLGMWILFGAIGTWVLKVTGSELLNVKGFNWWLTTIFGGIFTMVVLAPQSIYQMFQKSKKAKGN